MSTNSDPTPPSGPQEAPTLVANLIALGKKLLQRAREGLTVLMEPPPQPPAIPSSQGLQRASPHGTVNLQKLGSMLDGWADLVDNMGHKATAVKDAVLKGLADRNMPDITVSYVYGTVNMTSERRPHTLTSTHPGATTTIYIAQHGKDLYVSWRTFMRRVPKWWVIIAMVVLALIWGYLTSGMAGAGLLDDTRSNKDFLTLIKGVGACCCGIVPGIGFLLVEFSLALVAGFFLARDPFLVFTYQPTIFDADDVTAMSIAAHHAIQTALKDADIDTALLRTKTEFTGGRRGERV